MRRVVAFLDKVRQNRLLHQLALAEQLRQAGGEMRRQRLGQHHEAHAQPREERLGKGAHVDDAVVLVQALQRCQRPALEAELAVVVVLDDPRAALPRVFEQHAPPRQAHHGAERVLVRGRGKEKARRVLQPCGVGRDAFVIHRHRDHVDARVGQQAARAPVAGIFHPCLVARVGQQARDQVDGLVDAGGQDDLLGLAAHRARQPQVLGQHAPQRHIAAVVGIGQQLGARIAPVLVQQPGPGCMGE
ncbi:hypothetical protein D9M68_681410 [compost metagenome]